MNKIGSFADAVWVWFVRSSANPSQISATVKYGLLTTGVILSSVLGFAHVQFPVDQWSSISDSIIGLIQSILLVVGTIGTIVGAVRKLWNTIKSPVLQVPTVGGSQNDGGSPAIPPVGGSQNA